MQDEFVRNYPSLNVEIFGINEIGADPTGFITEGRDIPWLLESDNDGNGLGDIRDDTWQVVYRDVVLVDEQSVMISQYNLTQNSLGVAANYNALRQMFIDAAAKPAESDWQSPIEKLDINADGVISPLDGLLVINNLGVFENGVLPSSMANQAPYVDPTGDGVVAPFDALAVINHLNFVSSLNTPTAALSAGVDVTDDPTRLDRAPVDSAVALVEPLEESARQEIDSSVADAVFAEPTMQSI